MEVIDFRQETKQQDRLDRIQADETIIIWGEADPQLKNTFLDRFSLQPSDKLAIWTIPPGLSELQAAIQRVKPSKVYLFGINPGMDEPETFLKHLLGLLKYRINYNHGITSLSFLAAGTAQTTSTIKIGLEWLEAHGHIQVKSIVKDEIRIDAGTKINKKDTQTSSTHLNSALIESAAFRRYFLIADKDSLMSSD
jgi:hypothetical protein